MRNRRRSTLVVALIAIVALALAGCSTYSADSDQVGIHVNGGVFLPVSKTVENCIPASGAGVESAGQSYFYYPAGQRTYKFGGETQEEAKSLGADGPAVNVVKDNITLRLAGTVTFYLNTDCETLKKFHTQIGVKRWGPNNKPAWISDGGDADYEGWGYALDTYIDQPLQRAVTDAVVKDGAKSYLELYNGADRANFEKAVLADLPGSVKSLAGGNYFTNFTVQIQKPNIPAGVADALTAQEIAKAQNEAQKLTNKTIDTELVSIKKVVAVLGKQGYIDYVKNQLTKEQQVLLKNAIAQGKVSIMPVPTGSNLTLPAR